MVRLLIQDLYATQKQSGNNRYDIHFMLAEKNKAEESNSWLPQLHFGHDKHQLCVTVSLTGFYSILALRIALEITQKIKCSLVWCHDVKPKSSFSGGGISSLNGAVRRNDFFPSE